MRVTVDQAGQHNSIVAIESLCGRILSVDFLARSNRDDYTIVNRDRTVLNDIVARIHRDDELTVDDQIDKVFGCGGKRFRVGRRTL